MVGRGYAERVPKVLLIAAMLLIVFHPSRSHADGPPAPRAPRVELAGEWVLDRERSRGMEEVLAAQGIPKIARAVLTRAKIEQTNTVHGDAISIQVRFPLGTLMEQIAVDGQPRPASDRRGDFVLTAGWTDSDGLLITRVFEEFVVRETRTVETGLMVLRFEVDQGGRTLRAEETYRRP
jgi:hypothetical protein